ncbi:hypothetical protein HMPREF9555_00677 [Selenomonas artemidis F0399]|uniref:Uncharacterized protein n=1 Tax=Selenomonas artemidis F0399 TaxID=749551 RepID=E7N126_9FIRM|nr:hypothetical protein HMPREF9555_00677 [Selenomonas artemidis F0399]
MTWWGILGITAAGPHRYRTDFPVTSFCIRSTESAYEVKSK